MSAHNNKQSGFEVIGWLFLLVVAILAFLLLVGGFYEARKAYWDYRVRQMCTKDGGVQILERVAITKAEADLLPRTGGKLGVADKQLAGANAPVYSDLKTTHLNDWNPEVRREEVEVIRRSDKRVVARWVYYARTGGDVPSIAHPSSFGCPDLARIALDQAQLFVIEGISK
jgi:hypothetical protein